MKHLLLLFLSTLCLTGCQPNAVSIQQSLERMFPQHRIARVCQDVSLIYWVATPKQEGPVYIIHTEDHTVQYVEDLGVQVTVLTSEPVKKADYIRHNLYATDPPPYSPKEPAKP